MNKIGLALFVTFLLFSPVFAYDAECNDFGTELYQRLLSVNNVCSNSDNKPKCESSSFRELYYSIVKDENNWRCFNSGTDFDKEIFGDLYSEALVVYDELLEDKKENGFIREAISLLEKEYLFLERCERYEEILNRADFCEKRALVEKDYKEILIGESTKLRNELNAKESKTTCENYYELVKYYSAKLSGIDLESLDAERHSELPIRLSESGIEHRKNTFFDSVYCGHLCEKPNAWTQNMPDKGILCYNTSKEILNRLGPYFSKKHLNIEYSEMLYSIDKNLVSLAIKKDDDDEIIKYSNMAGESAFSTVLDEGCKESSEHCIAQFIIDLRKADEDVVRATVRRLEESKNHYSKGKNVKRRIDVFIYLYQSKNILRKKIYLNRITNEGFRIIYELLAKYLLVFLPLMIISIITALFLYLKKIHIPLSLENNSRIQPKDVILLIVTLWVGTSFAFGLSLQTELSAMQLLSSENTPTQINYFLESPGIQLANDFGIVFEIAWIYLTLSLIIGLFWLTFQNTVFSGAFKICTVAMFSVSILAIASLLLFPFCAIVTAFLILIILASPILLANTLTKDKEEEKPRKKSFILNSRTNTIHSPTCYRLKKTRNKKSLNLSDKELEPYSKCDCLTR